MKWSENDALFKQELEEGFKWQQEVAKYFKEQGLNAIVPALTFRDNISDAKRYADLEDISCCGKNLEVKSRKLRFTTPLDFPFETVLVDTVSGWDLKTKRPDAYICISTITKQMICLPTNDISKWVKVERFDATRKIKDIFYECPKSEWKNINSLIKALKKINDGQ